MNYKIEALVVSSVLFLNGCIPPRHVVQYPGQQGQAVQYPGQQGQAVQYPGQQGQVVQQNPLFSLFGIPNVPVQQRQGQVAQQNSFFSQLGIPGIPGIPGLQEIPILGGNITPGQLTENIPSNMRSLFVPTNNSGLSSEALGTGAIVGTFTGAGAGYWCQSATHGENTAACVTVGLMTGTVLGTLSAHLDDAAAKAVPAMDCNSIKKRMNYPSTANKPKAVLKLEQSSLVVKPGQELSIPIKMDLATPGIEGKEQNTTFKIEIVGNNKVNSSKSITKACGGDYPLPVSLPTEKEGTYAANIKLLNSDNSEIDGGYLGICYTVANDGKNKCRL
ncbi:MAG: hypothetical protein Q7U57_12700 [Methylovulum sp.]|nr:hypothetical protein [Methylovulum sp.]